MGNPDDDATTGKPQVEQMNERVDDPEFRLTSDSPRATSVLHLPGGAQGHGAQLRTRSVRTMRVERDGLSRVPSRHHYSHSRVPVILKFSQGNTCVMENCTTRVCRPLKKKNRVEEVEDVKLEDVVLYKNVIKNPMSYHHYYQFPERPVQDPATC